MQDGIFAQHEYPQTCLSRREGELGPPLPESELGSSLEECKLVPFLQEADFGTLCSKANSDPFLPESELGHSEIKPESNRNAEIRPSASECESSEVEPSLPESELSPFRPEVSDPLCQKANSVWNIEKYEI